MNPPAPLTTPLSTPTSPAPGDSFATTHWTVMLAADKRYRQLLRNEIAQTLADAADVDEEMRALFGAFAS
jgi:hypothetical protein